MMTITNLASSPVSFHRPRAAAAPESQPARKLPVWSAAVAGLALLGASAYLPAAPAIPAAAVQAYERLSAEQRGQVASELDGSTNVLWMKVSNRQAFIDGQVGPVNVFSHLRERLQERLEAGELTPEAADRLGAALREAERLSRPQRAALVQRFAPAR